MKWNTNNLHLNMIKRDTKKSCAKSINCHKLTKQFLFVPSCTKMLTHGQNIMTLTFYVCNLIQFVFQLVTSFEFM